MGSTKCQFNFRWPRLSMDLRKMPTRPRKVLHLWFGRSCHGDWRNSMSALPKTLPHQMWNWHEFAWIQHAQEKWVIAYCQQRRFASNVITFQMEESHGLPGSVQRAMRWKYFKVSLFYQLTYTSNENMISFRCWTLSRLWTHASSDGIIQKLLRTLERHPHHCPRGIEWRAWSSIVHSLTHLTDNFNYDMHRWRWTLPHQPKVHLPSLTL